MLHAYLTRSSCPSEKMLIPTFLSTGKPAPSTRTCVEVGKTAIKLGFLGKARFSLIADRYR
jgi:hypothetical protein